MTVFLNLINKECVKLFFSLLIKYFIRKMLFNSMSHVLYPDFKVNLKKKFSDNIPLKFYIINKHLINVKQTLFIPSKYF